MASTGLNADGLALVNDAELDTQEEALAMMEKGRRTLQEARARQQLVKLSRQYYGTPGRTYGKGAPRPCEKGEPEQQLCEMPELWWTAQDR